MSRDCIVRSGDALNLNDTDAQSEQFLSKCLTEPGARLRFTLPTETPMPEPTPAPSAVAAPAHHEAPAAHEAPASTYSEPVAAPEPTVIEASAPVEAASAPSELHATTQADADPNGVPDLSQIQGLAGGNPVVTVILAVILVGGGTAGWKFWQKKSEQNHELAMKKADMELELAGLNGAQPPPCQAASAKVSSEISELRGELKANAEAHKKLQEQIDELADRTGKLEKKTASLFSGDFDPEELEERLKKIEKALKADKAGSKAKKA
jgi:hypothetical protein